MRHNGWKPCHMITTLLGLTRERINPRHDPHRTESSVEKVEAVSKADIYIPPPPPDTPSRAKGTDTTTSGKMDLGQETSVGRQLKLYDYDV